MEKKLDEQALTEGTDLRDFRYTVVLSSVVAACLFIQAVDCKEGIGKLACKYSTRWLITNLCEKTKLKVHAFDVIK